jgi:hypothetical protein
MDSSLDQLLAAVRISSVAQAYGVDVRQQGMSRCVFHADRTPSMSVEPVGRFGADIFRCFGCGAIGDVVGFLSRLAGFSRRRAVKALLNGFVPLGAIIPRPAPQIGFKAPSRADVALDAGTPEDLARLSALRGIPVAALSMAVSRGLLRFGVYANERAWVVTDDDRYAVQFRPMRKGLWFGRQKAMSAKGSTTRVPVGLGGVGGAAKVHIVEGGPDLLAVHQLILMSDELAPDCQAALGFLGAAVELEPDVVSALADKHVVIWAHSDQPGVASASRKHRQLKGVCQSVRMVVPADILGGVKDLNDLLVAPGGSQALISREGFRHV